MPNSLSFRNDRGSLELTDKPRWHVGGTILMRHWIVIKAFLRDYLSTHGSIHYVNIVVFIKINYRNSINKDFCCSTSQSSMIELGGRIGFAVVYWYTISLVGRPLQKSPRFKCFYLVSQDWDRVRILLVYYYSSTLCWAVSLPELKWPWMGCCGFLGWGFCVTWQ